MERIAVIAPHFSEYSLRLANALAARAKVILFLDRARLNSEYLDRPMPVSPNLEIVNITFRSALDFVRITAAIIKFHASTIHIQEPSGLVRAVICAGVTHVLRLTSSIVLTVHDPVPHQGRDADIAKRIAYFRSSIRRAANTILVHGKHCEEEYLGSYKFDKQNVIVTDHGAILDDPPLAGAEPEGDVMTVVMCGRMEAYKGLEYLCEAAEILQGTKAPVRFQILGRGPELERLWPRFAKLSNVEVDRTFIPAARLMRSIQASSCVVLPYLNATQSGVLAAALANAKFVIASDVGGLPDVVTHMQNGLLVPPADARALADAIALAASNKALQTRLSQGAAQTARQRLDWDNIVGYLWNSTYSTRSA